MDESSHNIEQTRHFVRRINAGDERAFEDMVREHYANLVRFAQYLSGSPDSAEDVVCEVFARLWQSRKNWVPRTTIVAYLVAAVRNRAIMLRRTAQRRSGMAANVAGESDSWMGAQQSVVAPVERAEEAARLRVMLSELPESAREAIVLRWIHEMSFVEIAEVLGTSPAAVQMQISRGMKKLREASEGRS